MAQLHSLQKVNPAVPETDVLTGDRTYEKYLCHQLVAAIRGAQRIDIIVSFLMESGVRMLLRELQEATDRGVPIRILTGDYLGITQPSALYLLKHELGEKLDLRFYNDKERSFHPKSYIFHFTDHSEIFIGSSNISRSALTSGIEWNYRFTDQRDPESFTVFYRTFADLFENHSVVIDDEELRRYSKGWHSPAAAKDLDRYDRIEQETVVTPLFVPRGAQIEALCALDNCRAEGATKALVQAATGVGKTYLAAFDSKNYERVLFVAHREEILQQAAQSFRNVRHSEAFGFFHGDEKTTDQPLIFASVATLGRTEYLNERYFSPDYFDYIVIDEFHHAVTNQYRRIVDYFRPKFLLGLTATPERMDGRDIFELCDYNVPYEISLFEAINKGMLVPFHYYGIYDETDYSGLHLVRGHYDEKELNEAYIGNVHRHDLIFRYFSKYGSRKALGFCCSRAHAEEMAAEFNRRGIPSAAVYSNASGAYSMDRAEAIEKLKAGELRVIFSVDMFNEGVDITSVDMVLFLRPTESPIVFLQQLGRGLRKSPAKNHLNVLDFIGNYEKAGKVREFLGISHSEHGHSSGIAEPADGCTVDFDMRLIDLFAEMDKKQRKLKDRIRNEYFRVKEQLGHAPNRMELFTRMEDSVYRLAVSNSKENPFRDYLGFLHELGELDEEEQKLCRTVGREFIRILETTNMSKVYKMPVLMSFLQDDTVRMRVNEEQLLQSWKRFFSQNGNWKDLDRDISYASYQKITDKAHLKKILSMPVHFLLESGKGFFVAEDGYPLALSPQLEECASLPAFSKHMKDTVAYRAMDYYQRRYRAASEEPETAAYGTETAPDIQSVPDSPKTSGAVYDIKGYKSKPTYGTAPAEYPPFAKAANKTPTYGTNRGKKTK